ncbi:MULTISPECIES: hypothetical protein [Xanthomonas]|uniref:hypothetical protein n=1 Tax=Xanthomonas TaxID=338 RepID=UPI000A5A46AC|nr:hypothetical protein [Xanthomonas euvesicatoria]MCC8912506.1 hypothetical protein [Xanthomonas euvesicatoria]
MKCDLFGERMLLIDGAVPVLSTQRGIVLAGIEQLGIHGGLVAGHKGDNRIWE